MSLTYIANFMIVYANYFNRCRDWNKKSYNDIEILYIPKPIQCQFDVHWTTKWIYYLLYWVMVIIFVFLFVFGFKSSSFFVVCVIFILLEHHIALRNESEVCVSVLCAFWISQQEIKYFWIIYYIKRNRVFVLFWFCICVYFGLSTYIWHN